MHNHNMLNDNSLPPVAWTLARIQPPPRRDELLELINRLVNHGITFNGPAPINRPMLIAPRAGACEDYAFTKRYLLLHLGFAESELLLVECRTEHGEPHMVLEVAGFGVLDNRIETIGPLRYELMGSGRQSPDNPDIWVP